MLEANYKYVDDVLCITRTLEYGARWNKGTEQITYHLKDILEDLESGLSRKDVTLKLLQCVANSLTPYLRFTGEVAQAEEGIPVLDTRIWHGKNQGGKSWFPGCPIQGTEAGSSLQYSFFKKERPTPSVFSEDLP